MKTLHERFPSAHESVAKARRVVGAFAQACGFDTAAVSDIVLAVGEACSNAVEHGHAASGELTVACRFDDRALHIEILDNGAGFDEKPGARFGDSSDWLGHGRGIRIMRALMDDVVCRRTAAGMSVTLEKGLPSARGVDETSGELSGLDARGSSQPS